MLVERAAPTFREVVIGDRPTVIATLKSYAQ
jgi:hypothetical protein